MQSIITSEVTETYKIQLFPNPLKIGVNRLMLSFLLILLPILLIPPLLYEVFVPIGIEIEFKDVIITTIIIELVLIGVYYHIIRRREKNNQSTLILKPKEIHLTYTNRVKAIATLDKLQINTCAWGMDEDMLRPAIRLSGVNFPSCTIGASQTTYLVGNNPKITLDYTDFLVATGEDWQVIHAYFKC